MGEIETNKSLYPFSYYETYNLIVTSAGTNVQLARAPWTQGMYFELLDVRVGNQLASAGQVVMWDQDLSNTTPTTRGSAGQALAIYSAGAASASGQAAGITTAEAGPTTRFYAGIAMQASVLNAAVSALVRIQH